jgi:hypothetical protein
MNLWERQFGRQEVDVDQPRHRRTVTGWLAALVGALAAMSCSLATPAFAGPTAVVELFQSQGCSSCPPANANILTLTDKPDLLVLSFGVTYWDRLGWKDTFASKENTQRQYDYANGGLNRRNVATPQVVINGRIDIVGNRRDELTRAIAGARLPADAPAFTLAASRLEIAAAAFSGGADVWLVRYDPRTVQVPIGAGENGGRTLPHRNVVRELVRLGGWSGKAATFTLPAAADPAYRTAILVQRVSGGPIIAAFKA